MLIRGMFRKKVINSSSNLKRNIHLRTKIKSNECLEIATEGIYGCLTILVKKVVIRLRWIILSLLNFRFELLKHLFKVFEHLE